MKKTLFINVLSASFIFVAGIGCSKKPTPSDLMRQESNEMQAQVEEKKQLAINWDKGSALVKKGEKRVKKAKKIIKESEEELEAGKAELKLGESEVSEGQKLVDESEKRFEALGGKSTK